MTDGVSRLTAMQVAFVTDDIRRDMRALTRAIGAGPWFLREHGVAAHQRYRGAPARTRLSIAMAYAGPMLYELIQQEDENPSIFREGGPAPAPRLHHLAVAAPDFDRALAAYGRDGCLPVNEAQVAHGARVAYLETAGGQGPLVEIIELLPATRAMLDDFRRAAEAWDGREPVRPFPPAAP